MQKYNLCQWKQFFIFLCKNMRNKILLASSVDLKSIFSFSAAVNNSTCSLRTGYKCSSLTFHLLFHNLFFNFNSILICLQQSPKNAPSTHIPFPGNSPLSLSPLQFCISIIILQIVFYVITTMRVAAGSNFTAVTKIQ